MFVSDIAVSNLHFLEDKVLQWKVSRWQTSTTLRQRPAVGSSCSREIFGVCASSGGMGGVSGMCMCYIVKHTE